MLATTGRVRSRALAAAAVAALAASGALAATPAVAATGSHHGAASAVRAADQSLAEQRVDALLSDYKAAIDSGDPAAPEQVRASYLTAECNARLHAWEDSEHADGVFQAQNIPVSWTTRYEGSGAGHTSVAVVFDWGGGHTSEVWYQMRLSDLLVSGVEVPSS